MPEEDSGASKWKWWTGISADISLHRKMEMSVGFIKAFNLENPVVSSFNQTSGSLDYAFTRHLDTRIGAIFTLSPPNGEGIYRYFFRVNAKTNINRWLSWSNAVQAEKFSAAETRFDSRLIYITRLGFRKRIDFLRLSPSVTGWLYYNLGGKSIPQYDAMDNPLGKRVPSGFHRGRIILNVNSKITDAVSLNVYYMRQQEFNLFAPGRQINVTNPDTGKINRPFSNYNVIGISLKLNV